MNQAVIFDIDGTLVDSVDFHAKAWQDAFHRFSVDTHLQEVRAQIGKGADQLLPVFLSPGQLDHLGKQITACQGEIFHRHYFASVRPFPRVRELFEYLVSKRKKIALASSAKFDDLKLYVQMLNVHHLVEAATSADDAERSKPHPDIFASALDRLHLDPGEVVAVGDTPYDAEAAAKAGMRTLGFLCGGVSENTLRTAGCQEIYADPADLLDRYQQSVLLH